LPALPALVTDVAHAGRVIELAPAVEVAVAVIANLAVLLDGVLFLAVGVVDLHDEEVEDGERFELDVGGVWPVGEDGDESAVVCGEQELVVQRVVPVGVVDPESCEQLRTRYVVSVIAQEVGLNVGQVGVLYSDDEILRKGLVARGNVVNRVLATAPALIASGKYGVWRNVVGNVLAG
jgi:hypothetical protein